MPFVCIEEDRQDQDRVPTPDEFQYMTAPEFSEVAGPVSLTGVPEEVARIVDALRALGITQLYCRYDGGHDEGFAWVDSAVMRDGSRIGYDALLDRLIAAAPSDEIKAAFDEKQWPPSRSSLHDTMSEDFAYDLAKILLFPGYGTGEYYLFGAFTVDFETGLIVDDPEAKPRPRDPASSLAEWDD